MRNVDAKSRMHYREFPVPAALRGQIAGVWHLCDPDITDTVQTIYPDGYCELIAHLASVPWCHEDGDWHEQSATLFAAQRLGAVRLRRSGPLNCIGVRLRPEASALLGEEVLHRSREHIVDLAGIDGAFGPALLDAARAFENGEPSALWELLAGRVARHTVDAAVARAVARLQESDGLARVEAVARSAGVGVRSLQTRFRRAVGLTPKEFGRLVRLQATLKALDADDASLSDLAADRGFADQAHATRELRRATGLAPARLRAALHADRHGEAAVRLAAAFVRGAR
jgi:AraC-like DNA-binding protein